MKRILFIVIFLITLKIVHGQNNPGGVFLSTDDKKYSFYVELTGQYGTVFRIGSWPDKAGMASSIIFTDTLIKQAGTDGFLFTGKKTKIRQDQSKLYLLIQGNDRKRSPMIEIDTITNTGPANTDINHGYWWDNFLHLCKNIDSTFPLYHYSFRNGFEFWRSFDNKEIYYKDFKIFADNRLKRLKDSIAAIHTSYAFLTNEVIKNIATIDYPALKDSLAKLPAEYASQSGYFAAVINSVCNSRPGLFFKLAEDMPGKKGMIFSAVNSKEAIKKLKAAETSSVAKKEFFKERRRDKGFAVKAIAVAVAGAALLGFSIYVLVR